MAQSDLARPKFANYGFLYLVPEDILEIGRALKREFPNLAFREKRDEDLFDIVHKNFVRDGQWVSSPEPIRYIPKPRSEWKLRLHDGPEGLLADYVIDAWLLPTGWTPSWEITEKGVPFVSNRPDCWFRFHRSLFLSSRIRYTRTSAPRIESETEEIRLTDGLFSASYFSWEEERAYFAKRCKSVFRRLTTIRCAYINKQSGQVVHVDDKETPRDGRIGFRALEWSRAHPRHYIGENRKPVDWVPVTEPSKP